jgi:predicted enzyme related to lactoylglutathione lyase
VQLLINIDIDDLDAAVRFYTQAFALRVGRRLEPDFLELLGAPVPIYLLAHASGTAPFPGAEQARSYQRHWSPIHLDFVVSDIEAAVAAALDAGATLERAACREPYGWLALLADPFGHGFCFIQFAGRGYDELGAG